MPLFKRGGTEKPILTGRRLTTRPEDHMSTPLPTKNIGPELGEAEENGKKPFWSNNAVVGAAVVLALGSVVTAVGVTPDAPVERNSPPSSVSASYDPPSSSGIIVEEDKGPEEEETPSSESSSVPESSSSEEPAETSLAEEPPESSASSETSSPVIEAPESSSVPEYVAPPEESSTEPEPPPESEPESEVEPDYHSFVSSEPTPPPKRSNVNGWSGNYLASSESDKYHCKMCRAAKNILSVNEIWFDSEEEARANGYSRCGICW